MPTIRFVIYVTSNNHRSLSYIYCATSNLRRWQFNSVIAKHYQKIRC